MTFCLSRRKCSAKADLTKSSSSGCLLRKNGRRFYGSFIPITTPYLKVDLDRLAYETPDFSGAEIEQTLIEAMHIDLAKTGLQYG